MRGRTLRLAAEAWVIVALPRVGLRQRLGRDAPARLVHRALCARSTRGARLGFKQQPTRTDSSGQRTHSVRRRAAISDAGAALVTGAPGGALGPAARGRCPTFRLEVCDLRALQGAAGACAPRRGLSRHVAAREMPGRVRVRVRAGMRALGSIPVRCWHSSSSQVCCGQSLLHDWRALPGQLGGGGGARGELPIMSPLTKDAHRHRAAAAKRVARMELASLGLGCGRPWMEGARVAKQRAIQYRASRR